MKKSLEDGKQLHYHIIKSGFKPVVFLWNNLLSMYVKCRSIVDVNQVFYNMPTLDGVSWITMISGYAQQGYGEQAFYLFGLMQQEGLKQWCPPYNWKSRNNSETGHEGALTHHRS